MRLKTVRAIRALRGKRVLLRADLNVPLAANGTVSPSGDERVRRLLPTLQLLAERGAVVVIGAHLGRPKGKVAPEFSLAPVSTYLGAIVHRQVRQLDAVVGPAVEAAIRQARPGDIVMLENLRFDSGEESNDAAFARQLAMLADYYVNDAFGNCHRQHASMVGLPQHLKSYAGLLVAEEVRVLGGLLSRPQRPLAAIIGGVKLSTKLAVIQTFLKLADDVLLGGNLANTVLKANGVAVGRSPVEEHMLSELQQLKLTSTRLHLPVDVVTATARDDRVPALTKAVANVAADEYILDVGPDTVRLFDSVIRDAATVVWNGPMGKYELAPYAAGTIGLVHALAHANARIVVGGGETVEAVRSYLPKPAADYPNLYLSTGGGAMLKFLEQGTLVALEPLRIR